MKNATKYDPGFKESGKVISVLLTILLVIVSAASVYLWRQTSVNDLDAKNKELSTKTTELQATISALNKSQIVHSYTSLNDTDIILYYITADSQVKSPLTVVGEVPGGWSFEASFPVKLLDADGNVLASEAASLHGDWMTDELVTFTVTLNFTKPADMTTGSLVLQKDNPSGLESNEDSLTIPIKF